RIVLSSPRRAPPPAPLFPYTTLFRSRGAQHRERVPQGGIAEGGRRPAHGGRAGVLRVGVRARSRRGRGAREGHAGGGGAASRRRDRKSTRLNSSHEWISYAVFCLKKN